MGLLVDTVTAYLAGAGIGLVEGTTVVDTVLPAEDPAGNAALVCVTETGGAKPTLTFGTVGTAGVIRNPGLRVWVRSARPTAGGSMATAREKIEQVYAKLCRGPAGYVAAGWELMYAEPTGDVRSAAMDQNGRYLFYAEFALKVRAA